MFIEKTGHKEPFYVTHSMSLPGAGEYNNDGKLKIILVIEIHVLPGFPGVVLQLRCIL